MPTFYLVVFIWILPGAAINKSAGGKEKPSTRQGVTVIQECTAMII